ncbi:polyprenyl synthetase family protein [Sulfurihydrogenibium sp.]|uniref:polyprenyl synthetase family protein n=1 Tax=Sulfurihydrogenibium sp. TaxID=2053621 RepID=UPI00260B1592|nr:farnesyl diphosphate synthase [Sulfurihydrogenibium sp.]
MVDIKTYLKQQSDFINKVLQSYIPKGIPKELFDAMEYSLTAGGKRLRPILVLESAKAVDENINVEDFLDVALSVEFIHTYSLIHDDLPAMDDDDLRRGKPTCHKVFGEAIAILAGDGLLTYAFEMISNNKKINPDILLRVINVLSHNVGVYGMVAGQAADILESFKDIEFIHTNKTAKFISGCCQIGGLLASASEEEVKNLKNYGLYIGLAFQIWDDILDEMGDEEKVGKKLHKDKEKNKVTYPSVYGLEKSVEIAKSYVEKAKEEIKNLKNPDILLFLADYIVSREL